MKKTVTIKKKELYSFNSTVPNADFGTEIKSTFRYAMSKNIKTVLAEIKEIDAAFPVSPDFDNYLKSRFAILNKNGITLDHRGNVNMADYDKLDDEIKASINSELEALITSNKEVVDEANKLIASKVEFLESEIDLELVTVYITEVPDISKTVPPTMQWELWKNLELFISE